MTDQGDTDTELTLARGLASCSTRSDRSGPSGAPTRGASPVVDDLFSYVDASPSPFHAVAQAVVRLEAAGFSEVDERSRFDTVDGKHFVKRGGALIAWVRAPGSDPAVPIRLVGAHTDSPNLRIKPRPDIERSGYRQLGVEVYGGVLLNSWLDRDLGISGRVVVAGDGSDETRLLHIDRPLLRVAQLAIHLDRDVNDGLKLDRQLHLAPIWSQDTSTDSSFMAFIAEELGVDVASVLAFDLMAHDLTPSSLLGRGGEFYAAPRIDNLASCHAAVTAIAGLDDATATSMAVISLFDHEEVGSTSPTGADGAFLPDVLERIVMAAGGDREALLRSITNSWCISADGAHAVHPNYLDRYEPDHHVTLNGGPVVKINNNVRYATDAPGLAMFSAVCEAAEVPVQSYVHRTNLACGSTIGPLTAANLGMPTVDVGSSQLSMHSAREMGGSSDPDYLTAALAAFQSR